MLLITLQSNSAIEAQVDNFEHLGDLAAEDSDELWNDPSGDSNKQKSQLPESFQPRKLAWASDDAEKINGKGYWKPAEVNNKARKG